MLEVLTAIRRAGADLVITTETSELRRQHLRESVLRPGRQGGRPPGGPGQASFLSHAVVNFALVKLGSIPCRAKPDIRQFRPFLDGPTLAAVASQRLLAFGPSGRQPLRSQD